MFSYMVPDKIRSLSRADMSFVASGETLERYSVENDSGVARGLLDSVKLYIRTRNRPNSCGYSSTRREDHTESNKPTKH